MNRNSRKPIHSSQLELQNKRTISYARDKKPLNKEQQDCMMSGRSERERYRRREMNCKKKNKCYVN